MQITRTQHPIGQGCFHTGAIISSDRANQDNGTFHYVYDCGSDSQKDLQEAIDSYKNRTSRVDALFISHMDNDHVSGLDRLLSVVKVDTVYVPYINDVILVQEIIQAEMDGQLSASLIEATVNPEGWFNTRGVERVVRVLPPSDDEPSRDSDHFQTVEPGMSEPRYPELGSDIQTENSGYQVKISSQGPIHNWVLVPHVDPVPQTNKMKRFELRMRKTLGLAQGERLASMQLANALRTKSERNQLRECYNEILSRGAWQMHNRVSMSLYSGPLILEEGNDWSHQISFGPDFFPYMPLALCPELWNRFFEARAVGWIGTGDATLRIKKVRDAWRKTYSPYEDHVVSLLLPHHGSRHSFHNEVLGFPNLRFCFASAGDQSRYGHPSNYVVQEVQNQLMRFFQISQQPQTTLREDIFSK